MRIAFYTNIVSPHQLPFARELVKRVGADNYRYIYSEPFHNERSNMGWRQEFEPWIVSLQKQPVEAREWLENVDVLILGHRDTGLISRRCLKRLRTFYASERWFKPIYICELIYVPGWFRLMVPRYLKMAWNFVSLLTGHDNFRLLPYGVWAAQDFRLLCRIFHPFKLTKEWLENKILVWGYAVAPSERATCPAEAEKTSNPLHVLWIGRMVKLKHVDTLIRAVFEVVRRGFPITCTLVGSGPEEAHLKKLATSIVDLDLQPRPIFTFLPGVPIDKVRELMREHDLYVFPSDGRDGWGAVVSEALEEGMMCVGSHEAGASATLLPKSNRFYATDNKHLSLLLTQAATGGLKRVLINGWSASNLADRFIFECRRGC